VKNHLSPPVKVDENKRVIRSPNGRAYRWRLNIPHSLNGGRKKRLFFRTEKEAKDYGRSLLEAHQAVSGDLIGRLKRRGMTVSDAIEYALKHAPIVAAVTIREACLRFLDSRRASNCKPRYLAVLKSDLDALQEVFSDRKIDDLTRRDVEQYVASLTARDGETPASPKTRRNVLATIIALLNFAVEEGWRGENPAKTVRKPILDETRAAILQPAEAAKIIEAVSQPEFADIFPAVLIQMFAGPRRSELPHLKWEHLKDNYLRLDLTKTREPRAVEMPETLRAWLAPYRSMQGRILNLEGVNFDPKDTRAVEDAYTYRVSQLSAAAKVPLTKNVLRHTAITYRDALTLDLHGTARWAGNTPAVLEKHYRGAATQADAENFYSLRPQNDDTVVPMTAAGAAG
jgi:site-specific recombinase XerD